MNENVRKDNIFVCELSWELYTLDAIEEDLKSRRGSQPRDIHESVDDDPESLMELYII